jgi:hypothetical protein
MTERSRRVLGVVFLAAIAFAGGARAQDTELEQLLAASDLFARSPTEFRAELEVRPLGATDGHRLEVYRKGADRELVRFVAPKERGKFLLRRGDDLYFLAPGSRKPVALAPSYRVYGAAIQDLLGLDLARDYRIEKSAEANGVVTFELVATAPRAATPRLRWVVARATKRPLRADLQSSQGKVLRVLEFKSWRDAERGVPELLVIKDVVRGGTPIEARFLAFEPRQIDDALFDLEDGSARVALGK